MKKFKLIFLICFVMIILSSFFINYPMLATLRTNTMQFITTMLLLVPGVLFLTSLFDVWVPREAIEKHLGKDANLFAYLWMILLAAGTVGGLLVAFPISTSLYQKGAKLNIVFAYLGFASVCRIPMTMYEITSMGAKFTIIRWLLSIPLIILFSKLIEKMGDKLPDA